MFRTNLLVIPIAPDIANFWRTKFPDLTELFDGDDFRLTVAPNSYRPVWGTTSTVDKGYVSKYFNRECHELEGFDLNLAQECNCASVYYLLKDLEETSKQEACGSFAGVTVLDYLLPDLKDIKANLEYTQRQTLLEVEQTTASMGTEGDRSFFGTKLMFSILD